MIHANPMVRLVAAALAFAGLAAFAAGPAQSSADWFRGKTVQYIVATAAGGGYDGYGRLSARYMEKHLPGSTFVVVNRPGAGHLVGTNLIYSARGDGLTLGTFNMGVMYSQLTGSKAARFDLTNMSWVGKAATDTRVIMVAATSPYRNFLDLRKAAEPVPFAVSGVGSAAYTELQLLANVFGLKLRLLSGYSGNDDDMAMLRGEVVGKMGAVTGQGGFVRQGNGRFLILIGGPRDHGYGEASYGDDIAETPEQKAVMKLIASQGDMMRVTVGPPAIPADRLAALREAYRQAFADPELHADAEKLHYVLDPAVGEDVEKIVKAALQQPPQILAMLNDLQNARPADMTVEAVLDKVDGGGREIGFKDAAGAAITAKLSGSRSKVEIGGKEAPRDALKAGMACAVTYTGPGSEASVVACK